eukprot:g5718.t1
MRLSPLLFSPFVVVYENFDFVPRFARAAQRVEARDGENDNNGGSSRTYLYGKNTAERDYSGSEIDPNTRLPKYWYQPPELAPKAIPARPKEPDFLHENGLCQPVAWYHGLCPNAQPVYYQGVLLKIKTSSAVLANDNEAMQAQLHGAADVLRLAPESSLQQVSSFLAGGEVQVNVERSGGVALSLLEGRRHKAKVAGRSSRSRHARTTGSSNGQRQERDEFAKKRSRHAKTTSVHNYPAVFRSLLHLGTGAEEHPLAKGSELAEWAGLRQTRWYTAASYDGTFAYFWTLACNADPQNDGEGASPMFGGGTKLQTPAAQRPAFDPSAAKWAVGLNNEMFLWEHIPQFTHDGTADPVSIGGLLGGYWRTVSRHATVANQDYNGTSQASLQAATSSESIEYEYVMTMGGCEGDEEKSENAFATAQKCMQECDLNAKCVGFSVNTVTYLCVSGLDTMGPAGENGPFLEKRNGYDCDLEKLVARGGNWEKKPKFVFLQKGRVALPDEKQDGASPGGGTPAGKSVHDLNVGDPTSCRTSVIALIIFLIIFVLVAAMVGILLFLSRSAGWLSPHQWADMNNGISTPRVTEGMIVPQEATFSQDDLLETKELQAMLTSERSQAAHNSGAAPSSAPSETQARGLPAVAVSGITVSGSTMGERSSDPTSVTSSVMGQLGSTSVYRETESVQGSLSAGQRSVNGGFLPGTNDSN